MKSQAAWIVFLRYRLEHTDCAYEPRFAGAVAVKAVWGRGEHSHVAVRGLDWPYDIAFSPQ